MDGFSYILLLFSPNVGAEGIDGPGMKKKGGKKRGCLHSVTRAAGKLGGRSERDTVCLEAGGVGRENKGGRGYIPRDERDGMPAGH
nr:hypothetical protein CFP56_11049 [Quercus suber]